MNDASPIDFANGKIGSKIRNPLIAIVLFKNGLIDAFGTGFDRTFKVCAENNVKYEYKNDEFGFTFVFRRSENKLSNDKINDRKNDKIKRLDSEIINMLKDNAHITIPELAEKTQKSEATVYRRLSSLADMGIVERIGSRKAGYWKVLD